MKVWAIIQSVDYWKFKNGINPYHVYNSKQEAKCAAEQWFSHRPYEIREVDKSEVPKIELTAHK